MDISSFSIRDFIYPSLRVSKFPFLRKNEAWAAVLFTDILTVPFTLFLAGFRHFYPILTPNALSLFSFLFFFMGISIFFLYPSQAVWPVLCFLFSVLLDDIDGKFARVTGTATFFGGVIDTFFDMINHGVGIILLGFLFSLRAGSFIPLIILCPYAFFMGALHINTLARAFDKNAGPVVSPRLSENAWRRFCDVHGLCYNPYSVYEVYLLIILVAPWLTDPSIFLLIVTGSFFLICSWQRALIVIQSSSKAGKG